MKYLIKPLTKKMFAHLQKGRAIELSKTERNICSTNDFKGSLPELYNRGFVDIKKVMLDGKERLCVYITKSGISFLDGYEEDAKKFRSEYHEMNTVLTD
jgi:hypothetical protein